MCQIEKPGIYYFVHSSKVGLLSSIKYTFLFSYPLIYTIFVKILNFRCHKTVYVRLLYTSGCCDSHAASEWEKWREKESEGGNEDKNTKERESDGNQVPQSQILQFVHAYFPVDRLAQKNPVDVYITMLCHVIAFRFVKRQSVITYFKWIEVKRNGSSDSMLCVHRHCATSSQMRIDSDGSAQWNDWKMLTKTALQTLLHIQVFV